MPNRIIKTVIVPVNGDKTFSRIEYRLDNAIGTFTISNLKVELGENLNPLWTQAPEDIDSKIEVNTTSINVMNRQIDTLIKDTTITDDGTSVKLQDFYSVFKQTSKDINFKVESLETMEIKGANLLLNSGAELDLKYWNKPESNGEVLISEIDVYYGAKAFRIKETTGSKYQTLRQNISVNPNSKIAISGFVKVLQVVNTSSSVKLACNYYRADGSIAGGPTPITLNVTGDYKKIEYLVTIPSDVVTLQIVLLVQGGEATFDNIKVEKGVKATDWTPAPEDIDSNINGLSSRMATAEINLQPGKITQSISDAINGGTASISTVTTVLDKTGFTVKNGAIKILNKSNQEVLTGDTNGNLTIAGTFINKNWNGVDAIKIQDTSIYFYDWERNGRELGIIYSSYLTDYPNVRGLSLAHHNEGYMTLGYRRPDGTYGSYIVFDKYAKNPTYPSPIRVLESAVFNSAVNFQDRVYTPNAIYLGSSAGSNVPIIFGAQNKLVMQVSVTNKDDGLKVQSNTGGILAYILAGNNYPTYFNTNTYINGNFAATGSKARLVNAQNYGGVKLNAIESADALFEDIGEGVIDKTGLCYIYLDPIMAETINTKCSYQVFLQKYGEGNLFVLERTENYFVVKGTSNLKFGWRFSAKQKGYETERLEQERINITEEYLNNIEHDKEVNYDELASEYFNYYEMELINVV
ncbi:hypothetical protein [Clostridium sartagoforme]|uniref:hypothetical protein n=1 Tax=Clostridium sartagoforme TaxID=84031 RepID=UPI0031D42DD6